MPSMVLTQLLNPDPAIDRAAPGKAPDSGGTGRSGNGPSRYDEVVRQQEKRLEQRRADERTLQQRRQDDARRADRERAKAEASKTDERMARDDSSRAANGRRPGQADRPERPDANDRTGEARRAEKSGHTERGQKTTETAQADQAEAEKVRDTEAGTPDIASVDLIGVVDTEIQGPIPGGVQGVSPDARAAAQGLAPLTGTGRQPGMTPTVGTLFAAMLENGQEGTGKSSDLLAGLQSGNAQLLSESTGKFGDTLASQLATRLAAPDISQPLNQVATLRGQEAQALMRSYSTSVDAPVGADEWGDKVMGKLAWLTASQMSVAEIHITPPELGPIDVRVQVQNDQATVTVHAATPAVREQLELHGHRLRDMLSEQGLNLEGFDVSDSPGRQASDQSGEGDGGGGESPAARLAGDGGDPGAEPLATGALDLSWRGEVDLYA